MDAPVIEKPRIEISSTQTNLTRKRSFSEEAKATRDVLDTSREVILKLEANVAEYTRAKEQRDSEQKETKQILTDLTGSHLAILTTLTTLKENLATNKALTEKQQKEFALATLTIVKRENIKLAQQITSSHEAIGKLTEVSNLAPKVFADTDVSIKKLEASTITLEQRITDLEDLSIANTDEQDKLKSSLSILPTNYATLSTRLTELQEKFASKEALAARVSIIEDQSKTTEKADKEKIAALETNISSLQSSVKVLMEDALKEQRQSAEKKQRDKEYTIQTRKRKSIVLWSLGGLGVGTLAFIYWLWIYTHKR